MPKIYTTNADGRVVSPTTTWAGARDAATGSSVNITETYNDIFVGVSRFGSRGGGNTYRVTRSFYTFVTSGVTSAVASASLNIYGGGTNNGSAIGVKSIAMIGDLAVEDFDNIVGSGWQGNSMYGIVTDYTTRVETTAWNTSGNNSMEGTNSLMSDIETNSNVVICVLNYTNDYKNVAPSSNSTWKYGGYYTENTGITKDPYLEYTLAGYPNAINLVASTNLKQVNTTKSAEIDKIIGV